MVNAKVQEIESAIEGLTPDELAQLYSWLEQYGPQRIDIRMESDLSSGRLDHLIRRALEEESSGQVRPL